MKQQESHLQSNPSTLWWTSSPLGATAQRVPHLGFLPVPCVKWHHMHMCLLFMKYMLKQEDRTFYVPIIYLFFQINASETNSFCTVGSLSLQAGSDPRFCSLFSVYTAKTLYSPTAKGSLPPKPQFCTYRYHSTAIYLGTSFLALTESSCSFYELLRCTTRDISVEVLAIKNLN